MAFNKNDILARLKNGENLDTITKELTTALNEANSEYQKEVAAKKEREKREIARATKRREIVERLVNDIREFAALEDVNLNPRLFNLSDENINDLINALHETFAALGQVKEFAAKTDDDVLADFLNSLFGA